MHSVLSAYLAEQGWPADVSSASICTCWTSLVVRVISDGVPKCPTSRAEKSCTRWKTAARTSRPTANCRPRTAVDAADGADDLHQRDGEHHAAQVNDVAGVALDHAVVDDLGVQARQVQRRERMHELQPDDKPNGAPVRARIGAQQPDQHDVARITGGTRPGRSAVQGADLDRYQLRVEGFAVVARTGDTDRTRRGQRQQIRDDIRPGEVRLSAT